MKQLTMFQSKPTGQWGWRPPNELPEITGKYDDLIVDVETTGLDVWGNDVPVGIGVMARADKRRWYLPFGHEGGGNLDEELIRRWAKTELRDVHVTNLNVKFDAHMLYKWGVDLEAQGCELHELQHQAGLLDEHRFSFKLNALAKDGLNKEKIEITGKVPIHELPSYAVGEYNETDLALVDELIDLYEPQLKRDQLERVLELEDSLLFCVMSMERTGARLNVEKLRRWIDEIQLAYQEHILKIWRETYLRINPDSPQDMRKLYDYLDLHYGLTEAGNPSFSKEALAANEHPLVKMAFQARQLASMNNKFLRKYLKAQRNGILRYNLHQLRNDEYGTITGRFSSSNVNIQQVMKPDKQPPVTYPWILRELFIPEPDRLWFSADASQIEFRLFAHYAESTRLIKAYNENPWVDFHQMVTDMICTVVPEYKRVYAKNFNFMKIYGGGRDKAARMLGKTRDETDPLIDAYDDEFPEARRLLLKASRLAEQRRYVKTFLGRRRRYHLEHDNRYYSALNAIIQGTAADVMKQKLVEVYRERKTLGITALRFPVHDELDGDVDVADRRSQISNFLNEQSFKFRVPIMWDVELSEDWRCNWEPKEKQKWIPTLGQTPSASELLHHRGYNSGKTKGNK